MEILDTGKPPSQHHAVFNPKATMMLKTKLMSRRLVALALCVAIAPPALAHGSSSGSELSALSMLPIAVSVAAPVAVLSAGAALTVVAVEASATGTVWVLERASDGVRGSVMLSADVARGASLLVGSAMLVTAVSAGWVLSAAGKVVAFVPNQLGRALLHHERVTR